MYSNIVSINLKIIYKYFLDKKKTLQNDSKV